MDSRGKKAGRRCLRGFRVVVWGLAAMLAVSAASAQEVNIDSSVEYNVYGNGDASGVGSSGDPSNNTVNINGVSVGTPGTSYYSVYGGSGGDSTSYWSASGNTVNINFGSDIASNVFGGNVTSDPGSGTTPHNIDANYNTVFVDAGTGSIGGAVYGGNTNGVSSMAGDPSQVATASNNTITIASGTVNGVYGGYARSNTGTARSDNNTLIISGGTITGAVYAGYAQKSGAADLANVSANNNTVTISGSPTLAEANIYGGRLYLGGGSSLTPEYIGNTLNMKTSGITVKNLYNFQVLNFYVPESVAAGETILEVTDTADVTGAEINIGLDGSSTGLKNGETFTLLKAGTLIGGDTVTEGTGLQGVSTLYSFDFVDEGGSLVATVKGSSDNTSAESLSSGIVAGLSTLTFGGNLVAGAGMASLLDSFGTRGDWAAGSSSSAAYASPILECGWSRPLVFAAVEGGTYRVDIGHDVDVDGVSGLVGLGWQNRGSYGVFSVGAFFEAGYSDYDDSHTFGGMYTKGDGDTRYAGGGLLGRFDWNSGAYVEGSFRVGGIKNKYHGRMGDTKVKYDITSVYVGAHAGLGYKFDIGCASALDVSAKYLWTRQGKDDDAVNGEKVRFKAADSHRVRAGARYSYNAKSAFSPYAGAAFEYEFDAKARAGTSTVNFGAPSAKGGTGIGELGFVYRNGNFLADFGVQGHVGRREGVSGTLKVGWGF